MNGLKISRKSRAITSIDSYVSDVPFVNGLTLGKHNFQSHVFRLSITPRKRFVLRSWKLSRRSIFFGPLPIVIVTPSRPKNNSRAQQPHHGTCGKEVVRFEHLLFLKFQVVKGIASRQHERAGRGNIGMGSASPMTMTTTGQTAPIIQSAGLLTDKQTE